MPEYLAPGLYVEEIDTGSKPIEGVSTSTAGVVGVTERGPANVPMLVTNTGDYARLYGRYLDRAVFGERSYLPAAVDGFFRNGGRRLYVSRVESPGAARSAMLLHNRGELAGGVLAPRTLLMNSVHQGDTRIFIMDPAGIAINDRIRAGDGSETEWRVVVGNPPIPPAPPVPNTILLSHPLSNPAAQPPPANAINSYNAVAAPAPLIGNITITEGGLAGSDFLTVTAAAAVDLTAFNPAIHVLDLRRNGRREVVRLRTVTLIEPNIYRLLLAAPLAFDHPAGGTAVVLVLGAATAHPAFAPRAAESGDAAVFYTGAAIGAGRLIEFNSPGGSELRWMTAPGRITLARALDFDLPHTAPISHIVPADAAVTQLAENAAASARTISVADRTGFAVGRVLRIGLAADAEFITIASLPGTFPGVAPVGPGAVTLVHGVQRARNAADPVALQNAALESAAGSAVALSLHLRGETVVLSSDTTNMVAPGALQTVDGDGVRRIVPIIAAAASAPQWMTINTGFAFNHGTGSVIGERLVLLQVEALDTGSWGDRLRLSIADEASGLVTQAFGTGTIGPDRMVVSSLAGIEPGTVLELLDADGQPLGAMLKVQQVNRGDRSVTLDANMGALQIAALGAPGARVRVRSREFRLTVTLLQVANPAIPSRADAIEDTEIFRHLSMDPRHSRYFETIIGRIGGPLRISDGRPEGESQYIRAADTTPPPAIPGGVDLRHAIRLGPEALTDVAPSGIRRAARHPLAGGDDGLALLNDFAYIGADDRDPANRRGIPALKNIDDISLAAVPGIVTPQVQAALVGHCEEMRFRFAVLDGPAPPNDAIADVQALRQNHDSRHAAIYYPWVTIPDPLPGNLAALAQVPVPPSGHMLGLIARTDIERGVHKAPANEVVRGITGLSRYLNKGEQDILNPFPSNINVIRDFRPESRAIRAWGARVVTSDPDYKYVPVRRLLLFIEKSIDRNMNWVVFEPNAEPLWTRVRLSITSFLTTVWRNGALEGVTADQAFFVNCDRTTMTQADIDNGRLICVVGVAAVKPAEFVIIRIGLKAAGGEE
jgi:phage tail sheath protein FI